tara:strand:- start:23 stop:265 length:243 start_codon:yes stop_codon:yes gene_type:complete
MFETLVLVCLIGTTDVCQALSDLYGPYKTKAECKARAYEIAVQLPEHMPEYVAVKYKCVKAKKNLEGKINTSYGREKEEK